MTEHEAARVILRTSFERLLRRGADCVERAAQTAERAGDREAHAWCLEMVDKILDGPELKADGDA